MASHTSKDIIGTKGTKLSGKKIVLCITGSVAAIRAPDIARELMRQGAEVYPVMTKNAQLIIHPYMIEWATGNPCVTELTGKVEHVTLAGEHDEKADIVLIAPSTANTIGKIAAGIDDTPVTTIISTAMGADMPIIIVPAMHASMYKNPIVVENIRRLEALGIEFMIPRLEEGKAKVAETEDIVDAVVRKLSVRDVEGAKFIVTAGPTYEYIDPVRIITNPSSGKMGVSIAEEAIRRGGRVTLIYGPGTAKPPTGAQVIKVKTTADMFEAVKSELAKEKCDCLIASAACADWAPEESYQKKVSTHTVKHLDLRLRPTTKIIDAVKTLSPHTFLVAFKAEHGLTDEEITNAAYERLLKAHADLVVANDVGREGVGFGVDTNEVFIVDKEKNVTHVPLSSKDEVARRLVNMLSQKLKRAQA